MVADDLAALEISLRDALIHGDLHGSQGIAAASPGDRAGLARVLAIGREYALYAAGAASPPDLTDVQGLAREGGATATFLALTCAAIERDAFLTFNRQTLEGWLRIHQGLRGPSELGWLRTSIGEAWLELMGGQLAEAKDHLFEVKREAKARRLASCHLDAESTLALVLLAEGRLDEAVQAARRASRMAAAEELPYQELFAHLVLARVRRATGAPFLASKILAALAPLAPPLWHPWIRWESLLAGVARPELASLQCPAQEASEALALLLSHARDGQRTGFREALATTLDRLSGFAAMASDVRVLAACLDCDLRDGGSSPQLEAWSRGTSPDVPCGFHGIVRSGREADATPTVGFVWVSPGERARRIMGAGIPLAQSAGAVLIDRERRPRDRTHAALAALALFEGKRADEREFFRDLYGFEYDHALHKHVLDMLVGRMRSMLGDAATLDRSRGELRLELDRTLILWDPRCERPLDDWILATLAESGPMSARETAALLSVSLRSVQNVLKDLTDTGACVQRREGRSLRYVVEDTTFSEPTHTRFKRAQRWPCLSESRSES